MGGLGRLARIQGIGWSVTSVVSRNVSFATASGLRDLLAHGAVLRVRGQEVREIRNRTTVLQRPLERCLFLHHRCHNVFVGLAETFWVLAGRNDVAWLQHYLRRAPDFSDDNLTWRAAYGPRLRNWKGVDQIDSVRKLLLEELLTRRAVMSLYDPGQDFVPSRDIPCNNWLHWLVRDNRLHLNIGVRSNDVVWGFSGINAFEWSVLHELMAYWVGVPVGEATFFASSFHLYDRHYALAQRVVTGFHGITPYDYGIGCSAFRTPWDGFDDALRRWFALEEQIRRSADAPTPPSEFDDPLLEGTLGLLRLYNGSRQGWSITRVRQELAILPETDLTAAAYEFLGRKSPELLDNIPQPAIASFFSAYHRSEPPQAVKPNTGLLSSVIKELHRRKDAGYADAWKRRGEFTSILANIARKVDRLEVFAKRHTSFVDESIFDTAIDLFVYLSKYWLFLLEMAPEHAIVLPPSAERPFSDHVANFDTIVDLASFDATDNLSFAEHVGEISSLFEGLHVFASTPCATVEERLQRTRRLWSAATSLLSVLAAKSPHLIEKFSRIEKEDGNPDWPPGCTAR